MEKEILIKKTIKAMQALPEDKATEISDFADYVLKKHEDLILQKGIQELQSKSDALFFLHEEEDIYTLADIKEKP